MFFFAVIFNIYSTDGVFVYKDNMESLILACDGGNIPQAVIECFSQVIPGSLTVFMHNTWRYLFSSLRENFKVFQQDICR